MRIDFVLGHWAQNLKIKNENSIPIKEVRAKIK